MRGLREWPIQDTLTAALNFTPKRFMTSYLSYPLDPSRFIPHFLQFLEEITDGDIEKKAFLRALIKLMLIGELRYRVFFYLYGPGGTEKSTLTKLIEALVGQGATHVTSLKSLNCNQFEIVNIVDKKLVLMNDTEQYSKDVSVLKAMVGQDMLRGRAMFAGGTNNIHFPGLVLIVGNQLMSVRDTSNAILRRIRPLKMDRISNLREVLISFKKDAWVGRFVPELPGIYAWAMDVTADHLDRYIRDFETIPSLSPYLAEASSLINPLQDWIQEEISITQDNEGSYIGYKPLDERMERVSEERRLLYPAYLNWCKKRSLQPQSHVNFSNSLISVLLGMGMPARKGRRAEGMYIEGIRVKEEVYSIDHKMGSQLQLESFQPVQPNADQPNADQPNAEYLELSHEPLEHSKGERENKSDVSLILPSRKPVDALPDNLYALYVENLSTKTSLKRYGNKIVKGMSSDLTEKLVREYSDMIDMPTPEYMQSIERVFSTSIGKIQRFGAIPYHYKMMGASPRILPLSYKSSINSTKKLVRREAYRMMARPFAEKGYAIVDFDLKSCYTSILLGLYPERLMSIHDSIEGIGLWNSIKQEFERAGVGERFHKPSVKVCVYSSLFQGGNRAMMNGLMENERKNLGLTQAQFLENPAYNALYARAQGVVSQMLNSRVIEEFRGIAKYVQRSYKETELIGPTGHSYYVSDTTFRNAYPSYLQSYEFALLAGGTLKYLETQPKSEILGHYHDGHVMALPKRGLKREIKSLQECIAQTGKDLGLKYRQELEVQEIYES